MSPTVRGMEKALSEGCSGYVPIVSGVPLDIEGCEFSISLNNLLRLLPGREVEYVEIGPHRHILIGFTSGEAYLATGFSVGYPGEEVVAFARFLTKAGCGSAELILPFLVNWPEDITGRVPLDNWKIEET